MNIGPRIKSYLDEKGISQKHLCDRTGISPQRMSFMLNGKRRFNFEDYEKICWALDLPAGAFIEPHKPEATDEHRQDA